MMKKHIGQEQLPLSFSAHGAAIEWFGPFSASLGDHSHAHDFVEIVYCSKGRLINEIDGLKVQQERGDAVIINYGSSHQMEGENVWLCNIYIDTIRFPFWLLEKEIQSALRGLFLPHPRLLHRLNHIYACEIEDPEYCDSILNKAIKTSGSETTRGNGRHNIRGQGESASTIELFSILLFMHQLVRGYENRTIRSCRNKMDPVYDPVIRSQPSAKANSEDGDVLEHGYTPKTTFNTQNLEKTRRYIDDNFARLLRVSDLADHAGYTVTYFCTKFKEYTGKTVGKYITDRRIEYALFRLKNTTDKIVSIALDCEFTDVSTFNRSFQRTVGMTPGDFRKEMDFSINRGGMDRNGMGGCDWVH